MTMFYLVALLLVAAAMLFVLPALLGKQLFAGGAGTHGGHARNEVNLAVLRDQLRELDTDLSNGIIDQASYDSARTELEKRVASDVLNETPAAATQVSPAGHATEPATVPAAGKLSWLLSLTIPVVAVALYLLLGSPEGVEPIILSQQQDVTPAQLEKMVVLLEKKLKKNPDDANGWAMMARAYYATGRYVQASEAYAHLVKIVPDNTEGLADILADYADTAAMAQNKNLLGEPEKILARALQLDPTNLKALALSGSAAFERRDFKSAALQWKKILPLVEAGSQTAVSITSNINEALNLAGEPPMTAVSPQAAAGVAVTMKKSVEGQVILDPKLANKADANDSVFIFARAAEGPRFPLAVLRKKVKDLPVSFKLDDTMSMMPDVKLSDFPLVVVGARISKSGSATPAAGDLEGLIQPVAPGSTGLKIVISTQR